MKFQEFAIPEKLNTFQLKAELNADEVYVREDKLIIGGDLTKTQVLEGIDSHIPVAPAEPTITEKLASVGLSVDDLKAALGLA
jgi:hypothetical protein